MKKLEQITKVEASGTNSSDKLSTVAEPAVSKFILKLGECMQDNTTSATLNQSQTSPRNFHKQSAAPASEVKPSQYTSLMETEKRFSKLDRIAALRAKSESLQVSDAFKHFSILSKLSLGMRRMPTTK